MRQHRCVGDASLGQELDLGQVEPGCAEAFGRALDQPRGHRIGGGRELGGERVGRAAGAAEEQVDKLEHEHAVDREQRLARKRRHRHRREAGQCVAARGEIGVEALDPRRRSGDLRLAAKQRLDDAAEPDREMARDLVERRQLAQRVARPGACQGGRVTSGRGGGCRRRRFTVGCGRFGDHLWFIGR